MQHDSIRRRLHHGVILLAALALLAQAAPAAEPAAGERDAARQRELVNQRILQGDIQGAVRLLLGMDATRTDPNALLQLLDLQVRLQERDGALETIGRLLDQLPPAGPLADYRAMQIAGAVATARVRLQDREGAEALWRRMRTPPPPPHLGLVLLQSYRQAGEIDECYAWAREQRRDSGDPTLWALELADLHQQLGECREAVAELAAWQEARGGGSLVQRRLLGLVEACDDPDFEDWLAGDARRRLRAGHPETGEAVLDALVQRGRTDLAAPLAWVLDEAGAADGRAPYALARTLIQDARFGDALPLLDELQDRGRPVAAEPEFRLLTARALSGLGRGEEALAEYRRLERAGGVEAGAARLEAARLLLRPLGRPREALAELEPLLAAAPAHGEALPLAVLLAGALDESGAARARLAAARRGRPDGALAPQLDFLAVRLDWWDGRPSLAAAGLGGFLERQVGSENFNDAAELLDLLAFAARDSAAVTAAAAADRDAFLGRPRDALATLHAATAEGGPAAEILDWRACRLAAGDLPPAEARAELARYRGRHPDSIRLDRLAWMEFGLMERAGLPADSLRAAGLALLTAWPESLLQDAVRRRLRQLDEDAAPDADGRGAEGGRP